MTYAIEGRHCELLRVELADGERVIAEVGTLVYLRGAVEWHVVFPGRGRARARPGPVRRRRRCGERAAAARVGPVLVRAGAGLWPPGVGAAAPGDGGGSVACARRPITRLMGPSPRPAQDLDQ